MIVVIDLQIGNIGSVVNMINYLGYECLVTSKKDDLLNAEKIILPGVGSFDIAMNRLRNFGLEPIIKQRVIKEKIPILGICLGMQLLTKLSEEGVEPGLGLIPSLTKSFRKKFELEKIKLPVPHMGWNEIIKNKTHTLINTLVEDSKFYFVHSYYVDCENQQNSLLKADYGFRFDAAINHENIYGVQFHPEKSHKYGMKIFLNFLSL